MMVFLIEAMPSALQRPDGALRNWHTQFLSHEPCGSGKGMSSHHLTEFMKANSFSLIALTARCEWSQ